MTPSEVVEEHPAADAVVAPPEAVTNVDKHFLQTKWCLWLRLPQGGGKPGQNWQDSQICGHKFGTVEDFWCMFNNVRGPFEIGQCDYSIFRDTLQPAWEHPAFVKGGRITLSLPAPVQRSNSKAPSRHNDVWLHLVLALIGENFDDVGGSLIGGLRVVVKRNSVKLEVWISDMPTDTIDKLCNAISTLISPLLEERDRVSFRAQYQAF